MSGVIEQDCCVITHGESLEDEVVLEASDETVQGCTVRSVFLWQ